MGYVTADTRDLWGVGLDLRWPLAPRAAMWWGASSSGGATCEPARFLGDGLPVSVTCRNLPRSGCAPSVSTHAYIPEWLSSSVSEGRF